MAVPSPQIHSSQLVTFIIFLEGKEMPSEYEVSAITVDHTLNQIPVATFTILDSGSEPIGNSSPLAPGTSVEIKAGYNNKEKTIFKGIILKQSVKTSDAQARELVLECRDEAIKMTIGRKNACFGDGGTGVTDSFVIGSVIKASKLSAEVAATKTKYPEIVQYYSTDWDFVLSRAQVSGMVVMVEAGKVSVGPPAISGNSVLSLTYGDDILSFEADMDAEYQLASVESYGWDPYTQKVISASGSAPKVNQQGSSQMSSANLAKVLGIEDYSLQTSGDLDQAGLKTWADAQMQKSWLSRIQGTVSFQGSPLAKTGTLIDLKGVGSNFDGQIYVSGVRHEISSGNWVTTADFGLPFEWFSETHGISAPPASGLLPGIPGLQLGKVEQIINDPAKETRIQISIPVLHDPKQKVWARMATFYATQQAGAVFYPEVGDEVILGFMNDDPRDPVILGSLYSAKIKAPFQPDKNNSIKAIKTKAGNEILFNDKDKSITIITPGKNQLVFSDKDKKVTISDVNRNSFQMSTGGITLTDKNKNKLTMKASGITLSSTKDINLKAKGKVKINGPMGVSTNSNGKITTKGLNITHNANMSFKASGTANTEISSAALVTLQGKVVKITEE